MSRKFKCKRWREAGLSLAMQCFSRLGHHTFGWFCDWSELFGFDNGVHMSIRKDGGHS